MNTAIPQGVQEKIGDGDAQWVSGWYVEIDMPGYNYLFSPNWDEVNVPDWVDEAEAQGDNVEWYVEYAPGLGGSPGRIGKGRSMAENDPAYKSTQAVIGWRVINF